MSANGNNDIMDSTNKLQQGSSTTGDEIGGNCVPRLAQLVQDMKESIGSEGNLQILNEINSLLRETKEIPIHGDELMSRLSDHMRANGGLDFLLTNWENGKYLPALSIVEQCLTGETLDYVVKNALNSAAIMAIRCIESIDSNECKRVCTKLLASLLQHSDETCNKVIQLGGLRAILFGCRVDDEETLGSCAQAFTSMSLFGEETILERMLEERGYMWMFPLVFHPNLVIKYNACLAVARFRLDKKAGEIMAQSGVLPVFEDIIMNHDPGQLAVTHKVLSHCHNKSWLERFVPVLASSEEDSRNLAAFHFCLEATVLEGRGLLGLIREVGATEHLEKIARSQSDIGSYYATQVLVMMGENVQEVPV